MNSPDNTFPDAPRPRGRLLDARLHLLDRQLLDDRGVPVGIVDDLELSADAFGDIAAGVRSPRLVGLVSGHVMATRIFGGKPPPSQLQMIPWRLVAAIGSTTVRREAIRANSPATKNPLPNSSSTDTLNSAT